MTTWTYRADQEAPSWAANWQDRNSTTIDFSAHTFRVKLINIETGTVGLTKTAGITGAATSPNVVVAWAAGELNIAPGTYRLMLTAINGTSDRMFAPGNEPTIIIKAAV